MKSIFLWVLALGLAAGCGSDGPDDHILGPPPPPAYSTRTTPQSTVDDYRLAWENRDSTEVQLVLADDYEGTSTDVSSGGPEILTFTKSDEVRAVHSIKADATVNRVTVNFGPMSSWTRDSYPVDPPGWAVIIVHNVQVIIHSNIGNDLVVSPYATSNEFKLKPTVTGADTTWQIVRWSEMHTGP